MKKYTFLLLAIGAAKILSAQNPAPAAPQSESMIIMNATAHLGNGQVIPNSVIGFENGKITFVADATTVRFEKNKYRKIIDGYGKHVYPGFIACNSTIGLTEIDQVRSTRDFGEVGDLNPNVRSIIAYNTDSKIPPTVRSNGVLMAQIVPRGGTISGQSSVVELDAWNWEDAAYKTDEGIHLNWPRMYIYKGEGSQPEDKQKENMNRSLSSIEFFFRDAKAYSLSSPAEKNLRFEAMRGLFEGNKKLYVHCDYVKEIEAAVNFCRKYGIKMVLVGGDDAWMVTGLLKENDVPVVLGRIHSLPPREDDDVDLPYKLPYLLKQAGVSYAISIEGSWNIRNLGFMCGTTAAYGLSKEDALMSITSAPAKILGIDSTVGTLEAGKDATFFISTGDALDMKTQNVTSAFIRGKEINLDNVQKQLYVKYKSKYGMK
ncbi:MAG: amidohydrolase family protein [Bacteroidetes bacterium]|nr:amidohydrolase family protein [Bacteroidota bacterium]